MTPFPPGKKTAIHFFIDSTALFLKTNLLSFLWAVQARLDCSIGLKAFRLQEAKLLVPQCSSDLFLATLKFLGLRNFP
jgi:hypothetical protein